MKPYISAQNISDSTLTEILASSKDPGSIDNCDVSKGGFIDGITSPEAMKQTLELTEGMVARNVSCNNTRKCLAKIDNKCALYAPEKKKKDPS